MNKRFFLTLLCLALVAALMLPILVNIFGLFA